MANVPAIVTQMSNPLYQTEEERVLLINNFKNLLLHPAWSSALRVLDINITALTEQIITGEVSTETAINSAREKIMAYRELKKLPEFMLAKLETNDEAPKDYDPYDQAKEEEDKNADGTTELDE